MSHIDPNVSVTDEQRVTIEDFGFHVHREGDSFKLIDPVIKKANPREGALNGNNLEKLLAAAISDRADFDKENSQPKKVVKLSDKKKEKEAEKDAKLNAKIASDSEKIATEISDPILDETGTRVKNRKAKEKAPREKKDNRYLRVARVLLRNPKATIDDIMDEADVTEGTAFYSQEAYNGIRQAFEEFGLLRKPKPTPVLVEEPKVEELSTTLPETAEVHLWNKKDLT